MACLRLGFGYLSRNARTRPMRWRNHVVIARAPIALCLVLIGTPALAQATEARTPTTSAGPRNAGKDPVRPASPGRIPLVAEGKVIGAIGCSGGTGDQDALICQTRADALE
jgi:uncharacterized protein GlcG (DUF336 family)